MTGSGKAGDPNCEVCGQPALTRRSYSESIAVAASPRLIYNTVSDVTRTGEWSPICKRAWWDDGAGPWVGAWFTGRNETADRVWQTRLEVVAARPAEEFAFVVGPGYVRWSWAIASSPVGAVLSESWEFRPIGLVMFHERHGSEAHSRIDQRTQEAVTGIAATLRAIKAIAERSPG